MKGTSISGKCTGAGSARRWANAASRWARGRVQNIGSDRPGSAGPVSRTVIAASIRTWFGSCNRPRAPQVKARYSPFVNDLVKVVSRSTEER